jgi:hypothetical protein
MCCVLLVYSWHPSSRQAGKTPSTQQLPRHVEQAAAAAAAASQTHAPHANCSHGSCTYENGNHYEGEWASDKRQGWGLLTTAGGDVYEGEWAEDCPHGGRAWCLHSPTACKHA